MFFGSSEPFLWFHLFFFWFIVLWTILDRLSWISVWRSCHWRHLCVFLAPCQRYQDCVVRSEHIKHHSVYSRESVTGKRGTHIVSSVRFYNAASQCVTWHLMFVLTVTFTHWQEVGGNCVMRSCMVYTLRPVLLGWSKQGGWDGRGMWRAWGRLGVHTTFWLVGLKGEDH
jgi:hypothetical protein